jgi:hypothetical protein
MVNTRKWGYCLVRSSTVFLKSSMTGYSPDAPGAIQAKLAYLRLRKAALDELINSLERYSVYEIPPARKVRREPQKQLRLRRLAGAA